MEKRLLPSFDKGGLTCSVERSAPRASAGQTRMCYLQVSAITFTDSTSRRLIGTSGPSTINRNSRFHIPS
jgi:hypothetical protein